MYEKIIKKNIKKIKNYVDILFSKCYTTKADVKKRASYYIT